MFSFRKRVLAELAELRQLALKGLLIMSDFATSLAAINDATNAVATRIAAIQAQLAAALAAGTPPTQAQLDEMASIVAHLNAIGADPANPVPAPPAGPVSPAA